MSSRLVAPRSANRLGRSLHLAAFSARLRLMTLAVEFFMGIGAIAGGYRLLQNAEDFGLKDAWLRGSPFSDYTIPGLFLAIVIGGGMLVAAALAWVRSELALLFAAAMGALLITWLIIETAIIGLHGSQQAVMLVICGACGLALICAAFVSLRRAS